MYRVKTRVIPRDRAHHAPTAISDLIVEPQDWRVRSHDGSLAME